MKEWLSGLRRWFAKSKCNVLHRGFESYLFRFVFIFGRIEQWSARWAHIPKVIGSNPILAFDNNFKNYASI
jgi:hypothetical protein